MAWNVSISREFPASEDKSLLRYPTDRLWYHYTAEACHFPNYFMFWKLFKTLTISWLPLSCPKERLFSLSWLIVSFVFRLGWGGGSRPVWWIYTKVTLVRPLISGGQTHGITLQISPKSLCGWRKNWEGETRESLSALVLRELKLSSSLWTGWQVCGEVGGGGERWGWEKRRRIPLELWCLPLFPFGATWN